MTFFQAAEVAAGTDSLVSHHGAIKIVGRIEAYCSGLKLVGKDASILPLSITMMRALEWTVEPEAIYVWCHNTNMGASILTTIKEYQCEEEEALFRKNHNFTPFHKRYKLVLAEEDE